MAPRFIIIVIATFCIAPTTSAAFNATQLTDTLASFNISSIDDVSPQVIEKFIEWINAPVSCTDWILTTAQLTASAPAWITHPTPSFSVALEGEIHRWVQIIAREYAPVGQAIRDTIGSIIRFFTGAAPPPPRPTVQFTPRQMTLPSLITEWQMPRFLQSILGQENFPDWFLALAFAPGVIADAFAHAYVRTKEPLSVAERLLQALPPPPHERCFTGDSEFDRLRIHRPPHAAADKHADAPPNPTVSRVKRRSRPQPPSRLTMMSLYRVVFEKLKVESSLLDRLGFRRNATLSRLLHRVEIDELLNKYPPSAACSAPHQVSVDMHRGGQFMTACNCLFNNASYCYWPTGAARARSVSYLFEMLMTALFTSYDSIASSVATVANTTTNAASTATTWLAAAYFNVASVFSTTFSTLGAICMAIVNIGIAMYDTVTFIARNWLVTSTIIATILVLAILARILGLFNRPPPQPVAAVPELRDDSDVESGAELPPTPPPDRDDATSTSTVYYADDIVHFHTPQRRPPPYSMHVTNEILDRADKIKIYKYAKGAVNPALYSSR